MLGKLDLWFTHITTPKEQLSNKAICPFAKPAITRKSYSVEATSIETIETQVTTADTVNLKVCIFTLEDYKEYTILELEEKTQELNRRYLKEDKAVLDNDPRNPFNLNGVITTFPDCYLWIVQSLSDLNEKSETLKATNYYSFWTQKQIDEVVTWRNHTKT